MVNLTNVSFEVESQDKDLDVCGSGVVFAKLSGANNAPVREEIVGTGSGIVENVILSQVENSNRWAWRWKPKQAGLYKLRYKGKIQGLVIDHPVSG